MISKNYGKAELKIVEFTLDDVLTSSGYVTTLPEDDPYTTTQGGISTGGGKGSGDVVFNYEDFFK